MILKLTFFFLFILLNVFSVSAQDDNDGEEDIYTIKKYVKEENKKKAVINKPRLQQEKDWGPFTGGGIGLNFGTTTLLQLQPTFGYIYKKRFLIGLNGNISYLNAKLINFKTSTYSGGLFTRIILHDYVFVQVEWELLNYEPIDYFNRIYPRRTVPSFFVGGGLRQEISDNITFNIALLYNLIQRTDNPYPNPLIRTGIIILL